MKNSVKWKGRKRKATEIRSREAEVRDYNEGKGSQCIVSHV